MNSCTRVMIGNHGEDLKTILPTLREGYALFDDWYDHKFEASLIIDFDGWRREIVPMVVDKTHLRSLFKFKSGVLELSWRSDKICEAKGVLIRCDAGSELGVHYCLTPSNPQPLIRNNRIRVNYKLESHGGSEPYHLSGDFLYKYGDLYYDAGRIDD